MAEDSKKSNIKQEYNVAQTGLNLDSSQNNIKKGALSYALNAAVENFDANSIQYQNEPGNETCFDFPEGYKLVGKYFIPEQDKIIFMLSNPESRDSEIGYMKNNNCIYKTLVNAVCLNFDIHRPILGIAHKVTNFGTELYWSDNNGRRYLDIENIPYIALETSEICDPKNSSLLDCNKISLQPNINIPFVHTLDVISGGEITSGTYQFTAQYCDAQGNPYTSYYGVTNPTPIADVNLATVNFDYKVGKSIIVKVDNLNPLGQYQYFNLAVIKTINDISTPEIVGTYFIDNTFKEIIYTGQNQTALELSMNDIFEKFTYYDNADYVTTVQDILVWKGMTAVERLSYQKIANQIELQWQSYRIPASEGYADETNAANLRGYLRDEVYAFEIVFLLSNGKETDGFHIPGRPKGVIELTSSPIDQTNPDFIGTPNANETTSPLWKIYNTASIEGTSPEYDPTDDNYKGPYQYGDFAYWESTEEYPCDEDVWGDLAGQKIRHHKMPDVLISPIIESTLFESPENLVVEDVAIFSLGVKIDSEKIKDIIQLSDLTKAQQDQIIGYRIGRANRGVNKSIIAKGMLRNVGKYEKDDQTFLYPNYPYNDVKEDVFLSATNNAWIDECEQYTIEVYNIKPQPAGNKYSDLPAFAAVEFKSCDNNKTDYAVWDEPGTYYVCSTTRPRFVSEGVDYNKMTHSNGGSTAVPTSDGILYPSNYDEYVIDWRVDNAAGMDVAWNDIVTGATTQWLCCPALGGGPTLKVRVPVGEAPTCTDDSCWKSGISGGKYKFTTYLIKEVRVPACSLDAPLTIGEQEEVLFTRQIFNSPETSFAQPFLGNILKLESVMYGGGKAHFVEVKDNAKYKLLTKEATKDALLAAEKVGAITGAFSVEAMFSVYNSYVTTYINGITRKNYAYSFNSTASYNYMQAIPNSGNKQRNLDIKRYITPDVLSVGEPDGIIINNYNRETSVYLRTHLETVPFPIPSEHEAMTTIGLEDNSRFTISSKNNCSKPEKQEDISVVSYYGSLKNEFVNQYGQIYSYETIDTGFVKLFNNMELNEDIIFGGDTYIGRFAYKTKVPFFFDNRVNSPNDSDIFYDEIGTIAYPKYWHSSRSILETYQSSIRDGLTLNNFISYKAHNFDCPNDQGPDPIPDGDDAANYPDRTFYDGYFYMFAYGVPSFYCESSYNLDLRTAFNNKEGDFWPHVSTGIPDEWFQETNVSILNDNTYNYNPTFSKQNKETVFTNLPIDWGTGEDRIKYPFRAVYSDKQITDADNRVNNWLTYRPVSYFDFPQNYGALTALDGLKNRAILARFENKSLLYNSLLTIDTSNPQAAYIGNSRLFTEAPPIDFAETDQGYVGSQHKMLLKTPFGALSVDAKRGQVFLINGQDLEDLSQFGSGMHRWFTAHLPFEILKYFPDTNTDNHFNGIGLHGVFDSNYERAIITKLDYIPLYDTITFENGKYYIVEDGYKKEIYLIDSDYFCNVSWTLSFNFNSKSWVSFHTYIPNWYVGENNFFYSGLNFCPNDFDALVGVLDANYPTTTTTTTIPLTTTTSTTIPEVLPDCDFDVTATVPDCTLEGSGVFVDAEPVEPCTRPMSVNRNQALFTGYTLVSPVTSAVTTTSSALACANMELYNIFEGGDGNYVPTYVETDIDGSYTLGSIYYDATTYPDCTKLPDGWYFTSESANANTVFRLLGGQIVETNVCATSETTTTTTTTLLPTFTTCYTGIYTDPDPLHPLGGIVQYLDEYGNTQTVSGIWDTDLVSVTYASIISTSGVIVDDCNPSYNLAVAIPECKTGNCNDNGACSVRYLISVTGAPVGAYYTIQTFSSQSASVSLFDNTAANGKLLYSETTATGSFVTFMLELRDSGGALLSTLTMTMSHQSFWQYLTVC